MNSYIFIFCPPFSGSTLLWKIVSTSNAVSSLPGEGQSIPEVKKVMRQAPWNPDTKMPWKTIKKVWGKYWEKEKPLLLEKSPPNIIRAQEIVKHFIPAYFLIMVRNPYAHCEGLIRRNNMTAKDACEFAVRCLRQQAENLKNLNNTLCFTYEELVSSPKSVSRTIEYFIPQIGRLKYTENFALRSIDGVVDRGIVDLNTKKTSNLSPNSIKISIRFYLIILIL